MKKILISAFAVIAIIIYIFWCKFIGDNCPDDATWADAYIFTPFFMFLYVAFTTIVCVAIVYSLIMFIIRKEV